jgi:hypothetical protein
MREYGMPLRIRTDNGAPFAGFGVALYLNRFFRTFGAASKPLRSVNPLSIRE